MALKISKQLLAILFTFVTTVHAQSGNYGHYGPSSSGYAGATSSGPSSGTTGAFDFTALPIFQKKNRITIAHAVLAALAWVVLFPLGSILLRTLHNKNTLWIHAGIQTFAFVIFIAAVGMGIWLANGIKAYTNIWSDPHTVIGLVVFGLTACQPILGMINHKLFVKRANGQRTGIGMAHAWLGRILIILGIINGGLGLRLAHQSPLQSSSTTRKAEIGYGVVAGIMFMLYAGITIRSEIRGVRKTNQPVEPRREAKRDGSSEGSLA